MKLNMMPALALVSSLIFFSSASYADSFCDGFKKGYTTGYKQASGSSLNPFPPLCPLKPLKKLNDPDSDSERGYIIGLQRGMAAGSKNR